MKNPWAKLASSLPFTEPAGSTPRPRRTRVGARTSAVLLSAILAAAPLVALVQPTPAQAAEPVTSGNVEMKTTIAYDGTGHNTVNKCWISGDVASDLGMIGDNSPTDGVVCSNDAVAWELSFNVADSPTKTVVAVTEAAPLPTGLARGGNWNNWCSATEPITAVLSGGTCTFTIPANTSTTLKTALPYITAESKVDVAPTYTMTVNGSAATPVLTDKVKIVSAPAFDLQMDLPNGSGISYVEIDGVAYARYRLTNTLAPNFLDGASATKGYADCNINLGGGKCGTDLRAEGKLDVSNLPAGSKIRTNNGALHSTSADPITAQFNVFDKPLGTYKAMEVLVPVTALTSTQTFTIQAYDVSLTSPTALYPSNFNGQTLEPGDGQAISYPTLGKFGSTTYPGNAKAGRTDGVTGAVANNDWARMRFPAPADLGTTTKSVSPANTRPGGSVTATVRAGTTPKTYAPGELTLCDEWKPGEQILDASQQHVVTARVAGEIAPRVLTASEYHLQYGTAASARYGSGCTDSATNWVGVAPADANVVRVVFDVPVNLLGGPIGNQTLGAQWEIPLIAGPAEVFPAYPVATPVLDQATVSANDTHVTFGALFRVAGPVLGLRDQTNFHAPDAPTSPGMTEIAPGTTGQVTFDSITGWRDTVAGDNLSHTVTTTATLSSCAIDPKVVKKDSNPFNASGVTITPADVGPDGLACTADDVSGWTFTWTTVEFTNVNETTRGVTVEYTVPSYAKTGTNIVGTTSSTATAADSAVKPVKAVSSDTVVVAANAALGQQKLRDTVRTMAGNKVGWTLVFFNYSDAEQTGVEFVDVLPYVGDGRGTTGVLHSVALSNFNVPVGTVGTVYVTDAAPGDIPKDTAKIDPGDLDFNDMWCAFGTPSCPLAGGQITGIYVNFPTMAKGSLATLRVTADTEGNVDGKELVNNLGKGSVVGALQIPATQNLVTELYLNKISGTVYRDTDKDGTRDAGEQPVGGVTVKLWPEGKVGQGGPLQTITTDPDGTYAFTNVKDGKFVVQIVNPDGSLITQAWTVRIGDDPAPTEKAPAATLEDSDQDKVDFGLWQEPEPEPEPVKTVTGNDLVDPDGKVEWTVTTPVPASNLAYESFSLSDPVATGLTFESFGAVTINGGTPLDPGIDYTVDGTTIITFTKEGMAKLNAITSPATGSGAVANVAVVVKTTIASIPADGAIVNTATVTLNGISKPASATTNWGELLLKKTTSEDGSALAGAKFELYNADKTALIATGTTKADGTLQFDVWVGNDTDDTENFWLKETIAPAGHVLPADPWTEVTVNAGQATAATTVTIENHLASGPVIPLTGGTGAGLLALAGVGVLSIALVPMLRRRKTRAAV